MHKCVRKPERPTDVQHNIDDSTYCNVSETVSEGRNDLQDCYVSTGADTGLSVGWVAKEFIEALDNILLFHLKLENKLGARGLGGALTFYCHLEQTKPSTSRWGATFGWGAQMGLWARWGARLGWGAISVPNPCSRAFVYLKSLYPFPISLLVSVVANCPIMLAILTT